MMFLIYFSLFLSFFSDASFSSEDAAEDRSGYYCMQFKPQMSALLDQISMETQIHINGGIYEGGNSRKRICVSHYDLKRRYDKINKIIEEKKEILLIAQQNSADLEARKNSIKDELKSITELDAENLKAYKKLMWAEYNQQLTANTRQIRDVNSQIKQEEAKTERMKPYVDETDTFIVSSITHTALLDFAKQNAPDVFDVSDQASINSIKSALEHLLG